MITLELTEAEAAILHNILHNCVNWLDAPAVRDMALALDEVCEGEWTDKLVYNESEEMFVVRKKHTCVECGQEVNS